MKKKLSTILFIILLIIIVIVGALAIYQKKVIKITPEGILKETFEIKSYNTDITYIVKNARGQFEEEGRIKYDKDQGTKITLKNKEQIFKGDKITIKYSDKDEVFEVDKNFDNFYRYLFINEIPSFLRDENTISYNLQTLEEKEYLILEFNALSGSDNLHKVKILIDATEKVPVETIIYDKKGEERIIAKYKNFNKNDVKK